LGRSHFLRIRAGHQQIVSGNHNIRVLAQLPDVVLKALDAVVVIALAIR
jgi:hypothetical protein